MATSIFLPSIENPWYTVVFKSYERIDSDFAAVKQWPTGPIEIVVDDQYLPFRITVLIETAPTDNKITFGLNNLRYRDLQFPIFYYPNGDYDDEDKTYTMLANTYSGIILTIDKLADLAKRAKGLLEDSLCSHMAIGLDLYDYFYEAENPEGLYILEIPSPDVSEQVRQYMLDLFLRKQSVFQLSC